MVSLLQVPLALPLATIRWLPWPSSHPPGQVESQAVYDDDLGELGARSAGKGREGPEDRDVGGLVAFHGG
jgi:hypothetical protein